MPNPDPMYEYLDDKVDKLRKEIIRTNRELAQQIVLLSASIAAVNTKITNPRALKPKEKAFEEMIIIRRKISKAKDPLTVALKYVAEELH